ncbi:phage major capsid protein [Gordonia sp. DT219]|uniref:phage major capsid protein n=1 Tax=Gordonia sp. DT219 TaxID=3416658 RepID=UPI003CF15B0A
MSKYSEEIAGLAAQAPTARVATRAKAVAREIAADLRALDASTLSPSLKSKSVGEFDADVAALAAIQDAHSQMPKSPLRGGLGASAYYGGDALTPQTKSVPTVSFAESDLRAMHAAVTNRAAYAIRQKGYSSVAGDIPPAFAPSVLGVNVHAPRLIDKLPSESIQAPVYEYLRHTGTTGGPGVVAEGAAKPESTAVVDTVTAEVVKLATHAGISWETLRDFSAFESYWQNELIEQVYDLEAAQILTGSGTSGNLTGLLSTSGILTHAVDTAHSESNLDAVELSIATMRAATAKADANLLVLHPLDWSILRRSKATGTGNYFVAPDPTSDEANSLWGVEVFTTTSLTQGTGVLLDTTKFGRVLVRDGITVQTGTSNDDFVKNIVRFVIETRIGLAVERPTAILKITGIA